MLKAFMSYPGKNPHDDGCLLIYAENRNQARMIAHRKGPWWADYIEIRAIRSHRMDKYAMGDTPYIIETNQELPKGAAFYLEEETD